MSRGRFRNAVKNALLPSKIKKNPDAKNKTMKKKERVIVPRAAAGDFSASQLRNRFFPEMPLELFKWF
eukprot:IDg6732t1